MLHPSTKKLIDRLSQMTERGKLNWTEGDSNNIIYATEGYSVSLTETPNELAIISKEGKELERATADELAATQDETGAAYSEIVALMTKEASRVASGTEAAISTLLAGIDLDGDGIPDSPTETPAEALAETLEAAAPEDVVEETSVMAPAEVETLAPASAEPEPASEPEIQTEVPISNEPDMTEAVARLADEVNNRQEAPSPAENFLSDAGLGVVAATALNASTEEVEIEPQAPETVELTAADDTREVDPTPEQPSEPISSLTPDVEPSQAESEPLQTAVEHVEETIAAATAPVESEELQTPEPITEMPKPLATNVSQFSGPMGSNVGAAAQANLDDLATTQNEPATAAPVLSEVDSAPEAATPVEEKIEPLSNNLPPEALIETAAEQPSDTQQSYSLSGIGSGFGLGALSATTEATGGLPVAPDETVSEAIPEKIIIDATDDTPIFTEETGDAERSVETAPSLAAVQTEAVKTEAPEASGESESEEENILKPRTRFNPWD